MKTMSKPTKYTPDTTKRLLDAIRSGFTVKAACAMVGVTDMTLSRWRRRHPDFDADFKKATEEQTWYARKALKKAKIRTYERKTQNTHKKARRPSQAKYKALTAILQARSKVYSFMKDFLCVLAVLLKINHTYLA